MENTAAISDSEDPFADFEDFCLLADKSCLKDFTMPPVPETSLEKAMTDNANCEKVPLLEQIKPCVEESMLRKNVFDVVPQPETNIVLNGSLDNVNSNLEPMETSTVKEVTHNENTQALSFNGNSISFDDFSRKNGEFSMSEELDGIIDSLAENEGSQASLQWTSESSKSLEIKALPEKTLEETSLEQHSEPSKPEAIIFDSKESEEVDFSLDLEDIDDLEHNENHHPVEKMDDVPLQEKEDVVRTENVDLQSEKNPKEDFVLDFKTPENVTTLESEEIAAEVHPQPDEAPEDVIVPDSEKSIKEDPTLVSKKTAEEVHSQVENSSEELIVLPQKATEEVVALDSEKTPEEVTVHDTDMASEEELVEQEMAAEDVLIQQEKPAEETMDVDSEPKAEEAKICQTEKVETDITDPTVLNETSSNTDDVKQSDQPNPSETSNEKHNRDIAEPQLMSQDIAFTGESATEVNCEKMEFEIIKDPAEVDILNNSKVENKTVDFVRSHLKSPDQSSSTLDLDMAKINRSSKRENQDDDDNHANKKIKTTQDVLQFLEGPDNEKITITKKLIEEVVMIKVAEMLTESGDFGFARSKADTAEIERENLKKQKCALMKTLDDQRKVIRKFIEDKKSVKNYTNNVIPAKVTRSVGLQVCTIGNRFVHPQKPIQPPPAPLPKTFSPPVAQNRQAKPQPSPPIQQRPLTKTTTPPNKPIIMRQNARKTTTPVTPSFSPKPRNAEVKKAVTPKSSSDVIDLTDDPGKAGQKPINGVKKIPTIAESFLQQALAPKKPTELKPPFPPVPPSQYSPNVILPPKPTLRISRTTTDQKSGIMLSWFFTVKETTPISKFQVYSYQEGSDSGKDVWKKVGDVDALVLPMACTLTQFKEGYKYYFSVRAIDKNSIKGPFSEPNSIKLFPRKTVNSL